MEAYKDFRQAPIDDRRKQGLKERDNRMVEDAQLPIDPDANSYANDIFGKLTEALGSRDLDHQEIERIVKIIQKGMGVPKEIPYSEAIKKPKKK